VIGEALASPFFQIFFPTLEVAASFSLMHKKLHKLEDIKKFQHVDGISGWCISVGISMAEG
jgi:hypothetical protein